MHDLAVGAESLELDVLQAVACRSIGHLFSDRRDDRQGEQATLRSERAVRTGELGIQNSLSVPLSSAPWSDRPLQLSTTDRISRLRNPDMRRLLVLAIVLGASATADAALTLKEIRTASNNVLVAYFKSTIINANEVNTLHRLPGSSTANP